MRTFNLSNSQCGLDTIHAIDPCDALAKFNKNWHLCADVTITEEFEDGQTIIVYRNGHFEE